MNKRLPPLVFVLSMIVIAAAGLGFLIGLNVFLNNDNQATPKTPSSPVTQEPVSLTLTISSPDDNQLIFEPDILIQGKTTSDAIVMVSTNEDDFVLEPGILGNFSTTAKLKPGQNVITIAAFDDSGNSKSESRTLYYSEEKI